MTSRASGSWSNESGTPITLESIVVAVREVRAAVRPRPEAEPPYTYRPAVMTFNGEAFPFDDIKIGWTSRIVMAPAGMPFLAWPETWSVTIPMLMRPRAWRALQRALARPRRLHAAFETLMRRASYGGRKGRRAMRRLMAMPDGAWKDGLR